MPKADYLNPQLSKQDIARLWSFIDRLGPKECWLYRHSKDEAGYGRFWTYGKRWYPHRLIYALYIGPIESGFYVCHHCDNPPCCNPKHLFKGTARDNTQDSIKKGRRHVQKMKKKCIAKFA